MTPVGAGEPAKKPARCMAPAAPVFAGMPAPTDDCILLKGCDDPCGSGFTREETSAVYASGYASARETSGPAGKFNQSPQQSPGQPNP